jgi:CrcB protein
MEGFIKILSVGIGGAFGAVARYLLNISPLANVFQKFPFPTFMVNIVGSFLIGFLVILFADKIVINENLRFAILIGFIGSFTTFSTFELEIFDLLHEKFFLNAFIYLFLSILVGFISVSLGIWLGKKF